jgi:methionyl-tRNA synthetase
MVHRLIFALDLKIPEHNTMREFKRYLVTSALPYANGPLHIGHLAGAYLSADIYVRFMRLMGKDIVYIGGSDEHGAAITMKAMKEGTTPKEIVDKYHALFVDTFNKVGISFDFYHRTSEQIHHETSQDIFRVLYNKGEFVEQSSEQYYDEQAQQFLADRYIKGTCPKCGYGEAYGDQCENCGSSLSPTELINPHSVLSGTQPVLKSTKHWYLPLDKYEGWLREWLETGHLDGKHLHYPEDWKNHVLGQCKSWLDGGLQPRAMTRDLDWGVDVPHDIPGHEGKKLYVWMDAPIGYISSTKQWALENNKNWKDYWQSEDSALIHFIGKDNIVFHSIIFPAILKEHGDYILPYNVPANQFMNLEGSKISTSRNWAVWVHEYVEDFPDKVDELRYCMIKNMPELKDSEFTWKSWQDANNNELVANIANFINRVVVLVNKYFEGKVPEYDDMEEFTGSNGDESEFYELELLTLHDDLDQLCHYLRTFSFREALNQLMTISSKGNQLLQYNEPWKKFKSEPGSVEIVLNLAMQYVTALSVAVRPFMPFTSDKIRQIINLPLIEEKDELLEMLHKLSENIAIIDAGHKIGESNHLFTRIEDAIIVEQIEKLKNKQMENTVQAPSYKSVKEEISYDDFMKNDLRVATIIQAEKVEKADKLLKLTLDVGFETRTVVSGIALYFKPEEIIGKKVTLLANLAPRKLRGIESKGMILMSENADGSLKFVAAPEDAENGATIS